MKNRNRDKPTFANINLLGQCNADCFFCLGKDLPQVQHENQLETHFNSWKNFEAFLSECEYDGINKLFVTGQTADSLQYIYFGSLVDYLMHRGFEVGIRTNGFRALEKMHAINRLNGEVGYTINSLIPHINKYIMGRKAVPHWSEILQETESCRVSIVVNRYNIGEIDQIIKYLSFFESVQYIQLRRVSTDNRGELLERDQVLYDQLLPETSHIYEKVGEFCTSDAYLIHGKPCYFWSTVETCVNSYNYFTNGVFSKEYFIIEGYENEVKK